MLGVLAGLKAEARVVRAVWPEVPIALSGATRAGAERALAALRRAGVTEVLSFGCAAGLSPDLGPGAVVVPSRVRVGGKDVAVAAGLRARFLGLGVVPGEILHSDDVVVTAAEKARLFAATGCVAVDMESGVVAVSGLPFAVLRVVCDDVRRDLPPAAVDVVAGGGAIDPLRLAWSLMRRPGQIGTLMALGRDAATARRAMAAYVGGIGRA